MADNTHKILSLMELTFKEQEEKLMEEEMKGRKQGEISGL